MSATFRTKSGELITFILKPKDKNLENDPAVMDWFYKCEKKLAAEMEGKDMKEFIK